MRTKIVLDAELIAEAMNLTRIQSKREVVDLALREIVARRERKTCWSWWDKIFLRAA